jgi:hypothetical protein
LSSFNRRRGAPIVRVASTLFPASIAGLALLLSACSHASTAPATPAATGAQAPSGGVRETKSSTINVSGSSTHYTEREKCPTGNDPPAPQWYTANYVSGSTSQSWQVNTATPWGASDPLAIGLTTSGGPLVVTIQTPQGTVVANQTIPANAYSVVQYYDPNAPSGNYTITATGTTADNGADCGGIVTSGPTTYTDSTYSGTITYPGAPRYPLTGKKQV